MEVVYSKSKSQIIFEPTAKWVRVMLNGRFIADSKRAMLLIPGGPPYYYFPREDVRMDLLEEEEGREENSLLGEARFWTIRDGGRMVHRGAWTYPDPVSDTVDLGNHITFDWESMDAWFEENELIHVHPHNPHTRVDVLESTRHVQVIIDGQQVADTRNPMLLFETGLPVRYYIPRLDVRQELLVDSDTVTGCPYKGKASYFSVRTSNGLAEDIAWYYPYPENEVIKIRGRVAFYNERVDALIVDGEEQEKPEL